MFMNIQELIDKHGGITRVAGKSGMTRQTLWRWIRGENDLRGYNEYNLCTVLEVQRSELMTMITEHRKKIENT